MNLTGYSIAVACLISAPIVAQSATAISTDKWTICDADSCTTYSANEPIRNLKSNWLGNGQTAKIEIEVPREQLAPGHWLYLGEVGDTVRVELNGHVILDLNDGYLRPTFYRYLSVFTFIPPDFIENKNELVFHVTDLNQTIFGLRSKLMSGNFSEILHRAAGDFLMRTGSSLLSAFTLIFFTASALIAFYFLRIRQLFFLSIYGAVSVLYLISFSEIPRSFFDPVLLSGPIHFSLRLIQDLGLCLLLVSTFRFTRRSTLNVILIALYIGACSILWTIYFKNHDYKSVQRGMFYFAPLVAFPTVLGFLLSLNFPDILEGIWNKYVFATLVFLQVNDLLVFWQVYDGYFFVKWYIPLLFIYIFIILTRRASHDARERALKIRIGAELRQFAHDIRSPLTTLKVSLSDMQKREKNSESISLMAAAMERITEVSTAVLSSTKEVEQRSQVGDVVLSIKKTCEHFSKTTQALVKFESNIIIQDLEIAVDRSTFIRVVENLLQNAIQAMNDSGHVTITVGLVSHNFIVQIRDSGPGFPAEVITGVGLEGLTRAKENGFGYGLNYCVQIIESARGRFKIYNAKGGGALVEVVLPAKVTRDTNLPTESRKAGH